MATTEARLRFSTEVKKLPDNFLECRDLKHSWATLNEFRPYEVHTAKNGSKRRLRSPLIYREVECVRCGTIRRDVIYSKTYEVLSKSYRYPHQYCIPGVPRGVKPSTVLLAERHRRAIKGAGKRGLSLAR